MTIKQFEQAYHDHACSKTSLPPAYVPRTKFSEKSANDLTKLIVEFINFNGGFARRVSVEGRVIETKYKEQSIYKRIPSSMLKGSSDISSIYQGKAIEVEVKFGKDQLSEAQLKYAERVRNAGGYYIEARSWDTFINEFKKIENGI